MRSDAIPYLPASLDMVVQLVLPFEVGADLGIVIYVPKFSQRPRGRAGAVISTLEEQRQGQTGLVSFQKKVYKMGRKMK